MVEFKQSKTKLNRDVFESVCAFLNRNGGHLFLGVNDAGSIVEVSVPDTNLLTCFIRLEIVNIIDI